LPVVWSFHCGVVNYVRKKVLHYKKIKIKNKNQFHLAEKFPKENNHGRVLNNIGDLGGVAF
jgi:hypothetical protein